MEDLAEILLWFGAVKTFLDMYNLTIFIKIVFFAGVVASFIGIFGLKRSND